MLRWTPLLVLVLQAATVAAALWGTLRVQRLRRISDDPRLTRLLWFFGLFAVAVLAQVVVTYGFVFTEPPPPRPDGLRSLRPGRPPEWFGWVHHGFMVAALAVAVRAYGSLRRRSQAAVWVLFGPVGVARLVEAALTLYLALRALWNQRARRSTGATRVALGFGLFFLGHLSFWVFHPRSGPRPWWAELLALGGVLLLVTALPRLSPASATRRGEA